MAWAVVASASAHTASGTPPATTSAIDTTGADLLVVGLSGSQSTHTVSDSKSNTWTLVRQQDKFGAAQFTSLYYCTSPSVGSGHTFSLNDATNPTNDFASIAVIALSGSDTSPLDQNAGSASHGNVVLTSITPTTNNQALVTVCSEASAASLSIDSGFTIDENHPAVGGNSFGIGLAHLFQSTAAAIAPTWTVGGGSAVIASFKMAAGGGGVSGTLATTEAADTAALVGEVPPIGTLVATEAADTAAFAGLVGWKFVGISATVEVTAATHTLTEPAGVQEGDLLVAVISSRIASTTSITLPANWTRVTEQKTNNTLTTGSAVASGMMAYIVRGASAPSYTFTHPTAPSVAIGRVVAYRGGNSGTPLDVVSSTTTAVSTTAVSVAGVTTALAESLLVVGACGGQEAAWSAFDATSPTVASGATDTTTDPSTTTWIERADTQTTTGADTSLGIVDAVKLTAGATGNITATASVAASHAILIGAFRVRLPVISGALAVTETADTMAFQGNVAWTAPLIATEDADIAAFQGTVTTPEIAGPLVATEAADAMAFQGQLNEFGPLVAIEAADVAALQGTVTWTGTLVATEDADTASMQGRAAWIGTLVVTEAADTAAFLGTVSWTGTLVALEAADTAAFQGSAAWTGTLVATEATDTATFPGTVVDPITGTLVAAEVADAMFFVGEGAAPAITGTLVVTEAADAIAFTGQLGVVGTLAVTEGPDTASMPGTVAWTAQLVATEAADTATFQVTVEFRTTLVAIEAPDIASFSGRAAWQGPLVVTEQPDTAAFQGRAAWIGTLAATEQSDTASFQGTVVFPTITGTLAAVEAPDVMQFFSFQPATGALVAMEGVDTCKILGQPIQDVGTLNFGWPRVKVRRRL